jgi:uncharacterized protein YdeI (YjbR/CyaY-like superfamily)
MSVHTVFASTTDEWRAWLARHGDAATEAWLVIFHQGSVTPSLRYHEAIEHALCFGWIDSHARTRDADSSELRFTPRNPRSTWSRVNRERAARMVALGLMTEPGRALIEVAKANGTWQVLDDSAGSVVPDDLQVALDHDDAARENFERFPPSSKRLILEWIVTAKRAETRHRRIDQTVALASVNVRAHHPGVRMPEALEAVGHPRPADAPGR